MSQDETLRSGNNLTDLPKTCVAAATNVRADGREFLMFYDEADFFLLLYCVGMGTAVAQWLRCCATNRNGAGSIPAGVS